MKGKFWFNDKNKTIQPSPNKQKHLKKIFSKSWKKQQPLPSSPSTPFHTSLQMLTGNHCLQGDQPWFEKKV